MFNRPTIDSRPKWLRWFLFKKPLSASMEWWDRREVMLRSRAPLRYYLQNDLPAMLTHWKISIRNLVWWVRHRTTDQYHVVNTKLTPGYYEVDQRMLHSAFSLLVEYVEVGLASRSGMTKNAKVGGLSFLAAEINDSSVNQEVREIAEATRDLYLWWTVERPQRIDPWSAPEIWGDPQVDEKPSLILSLIGYRKSFSMKSISERSPDREKASKIAFATDRFYNHQDTSMLLKLVEIRSSLWT